jgi:hypothetical protein
MAKLRDTIWDLPGVVQITEDLVLEDAVMSVRQVTHSFRGDTAQLEVEVSITEGRYPHRRRISKDTTDDPNISKSDVIQFIEVEFPDAVER